MGVFDDILRKGEESEKEEVQENIEKIREKVQGERRAVEPREEDIPEPPMRSGEAREVERPREPPQEEPEERPPPRREAPEPESYGPTRDDIPEPPRVKELDVPDIEKGPLFITVDKFRDALHAIHGMRRVAQDMEDYIVSMEGTLQDDLDTEEGIRRVLDEAEMDAEQLKDIVSS